MIQVALSQLLYLAALATLLGLMVGSFLNVVIYRFPVMMQRAWERDCAELRGEPAPSQEPFNLAVPRSRCGHCGHVIRAWENIPVLSYLLLRGKCSACQATISLRYPMIELLTGLLSGYAAYEFGATWQTAAALGLIWTLMALAWIDFDTQYLPDDLTLPLVWLGLLINLSPTTGFVTLDSAVIGAAAGYLSLWSIYWLFKLITGKEGMGYGDFKLLAALGAWFGWAALPSIILLSSVSGAVIGSLWLLLNKKGRDNPIPFGPFLACAGLLYLFVGQTLREILFVFF